MINAEDDHFVSDFVTRTVCCQVEVNWFHKVRTEKIQLSVYHVVETLTEI